MGALAGQGVVGTVRLILKNIVHEWRWWLDRSIDRRLGTDTSGQISLDTLSIDSANTAHGVYYEPTPTRLLKRMFNNLKVDRQAFHLVDLGSGKGRVLLVAATSGFAATTGIEFARELHAVAQQNSVKLRTRFPGSAPMNCVWGDAAHFDFPLGDLVIFAYNPFEEPVMKEVMQRLEASLTSRPRRVVLIYYNDRPAAVRACPSLCRRAGLELPFDRTRVVQRPAAIYSNFALEAGPDWTL
ncbi:MAG: hypothetical protein RL227_873 [Pseudomonadota bacterium]